MKKNIKYLLIPKGNKNPIGYFLNNKYYSHLLGDNVPEGEVRSDKHFYSFIHPEKDRNPVGKVENMSYIRLSDNFSMELKPEK